jgi:hypothetical protein
VRFITAVCHLTVKTTASDSFPLISKVVKFPDLEPENWSGIPEDRILSLQVTSTASADNKA